MHQIKKEEIEIIAKLFANNAIEINLFKYFFPEENTFIEKMYYLFFYYCDYY